MSDGLSLRSPTGNRAAGTAGGLGYTCTSDDIIGPNGKRPERAAYDEVVLQVLLTQTALSTGKYA